jgi:hypothetical protein
LWRDHIHGLIFSINWSRRRAVRIAIGTTGDSERVFSTACRRRIVS